MKSLQFGLVVVLVLAVSGAVAAQPVRSKVDPEDNARRVVTIRGCLDGTLLTETDIPDRPVLFAPRTMAADRFRVVGDDELIEELLEHSGHEVAVIGTLLDETGSTRRAGLERRIGTRTRVWVGGGSRPLVPRNPIQEPDLDAAELPKLEIRAVIHVATRCTA